MQQLTLPTLDIFLQKEKARRDCEISPLGQQLHALRTVIQSHKKIRSLIKKLLNDVHFRNYNSSDSYHDTKAEPIACFDKMLDIVDEKPMGYVSIDDPVTNDERILKHAYGNILAYSGINQELPYVIWEESRGEFHDASKESMRFHWSWLGDSLIEERRLTVFLEMIEELIIGYEQMHQITLKKIKEHMPNRLAAFAVSISKESPALEAIDYKL